MALSDDAPIDAVEIRRPSPQCRRTPVECQICGRPSLYNYYSAQCCEGCKQFFRRVIVQQKEYFCRNKRNTGNCQINKAIKCNGCRLDKCLDAGMDPLLVNLPNVGQEMGKFLAKLDARKRKAAGGKAKQNAMKFKGQIENVLLAASTSSNLQMDSLIYMAERQLNAWNANPDSFNSYIFKFQTSEELIQHPDNILAKTNQLCSIPSSPWDKAAFIEEVRITGLSNDQTKTATIIDRLLLVETAKTMPFFHRLSIKDKLALLQHVCMPVSLFWNCFYSHSIGADTVTRGNGLQFISAYEGIKQYREDQKLMRMINRVLCGGVLAVRRMDLSIREFALMMAILYANSTSSKLSSHARDLLYAESVRLSRILLNFLQTKFGTEKGAAVYAERLFLLEHFVHLDQATQMIFTYLEHFHLKRALWHSLNIPKPIMAFI